MSDFSHLRKNLKKDYSKFTEIKVAVLGDSATQLLVTALKGQAYENQLNLDVFEADYDQIPLQINNSSSDFHAFQSDYALIFQSSQKLLSQFNKTEIGRRKYWAEIQVNQIKEYYDKIKSHSSKTRLIVFNLPIVNDSIFGNYSNKVEISFSFQLRKFNYLLSVLSVDLTDIHICDLASMQSNLGLEKFLNTSMYYNNSMVLSLDVLPIVAKNTLDIISAGEGKFKKCLILDLDNTMWGGVIGDDGVENIQIGSLGIGSAFSELQTWAKELNNRGIILAVCSKNTESIAKEPFETHPDMVLRLYDFAVFVANWENKADNIRYIQRVLNIGFDSMVFLDDNPFERNIVRENLPDVTVPELPEDPVEYLTYLRGQNLFETMSFSFEDKERTKKYQVEAKRVEIKEKHTDEESFLRSLEMKCAVANFTTFNIPRVAQLTQRSNQFNLRTKRYSEEEIQRIQKSENHIGLAFSLEDKFGDYGLISVVILEKRNHNELFIDTWLMSCRVLKRGVEKFVLSTIVEQANELDIKLISGEYIPTVKNDLVRNHFSDLEFKSHDFDLWSLNLNEFSDKQTFIQKQQNDERFN
jgi:FkbH-like protein